MEGQYSGVDLLQALESAHNYNDYLIGLVRQGLERTSLFFVESSQVFISSELACRPLAESLRPPDQRK